MDKESRIMMPLADNFLSRLLKASVVGIASGLLAWWLSRNLPPSIGMAFGVTLALLLFPGRKSRTP